MHVEQMKRHEICQLPQGQVLRRVGYRTAQHSLIRGLRANAYICCKALTQHSKHVFHHVSPTAKHKVTQLPVLREDALLPCIWVPLAQVPTQVCTAALSQAQLYTKQQNAERTHKERRNNQKKAVHEVHEALH
jgi:hypothetical protein